MKTSILILSLLVSAHAFAGESAKNNCSVGQGYSASAGCLKMDAPECGSMNGKLMGLSESGECVAADCVINENACVPLQSNAYYNNGVYVNGGSNYGPYSGYGYGTYGY